MVDLAALREHGWSEAARAADEIERLRAELDQAVKTIREWHGVALDMRDMSITGKGDIQDHYFNAAMRLPFYGCGSDPLPSQQRRGHQQNTTGPK